MSFQVDMQNTHRRHFDSISELLAWQQQELDRTQIDLCHKVSTYFDSVFSTHLCPPYTLEKMELAKQVITTLSPITSPPFFTHFLPLKSFAFLYYETHNSIILKIKNAEKVGGFDIYYSLEKWEQLEQPRLTYFIDDLIDCFKYQELGNIVGFKQLFADSLTQQQSWRTIMMIHHQLFPEFVSSFWQEDYTQKILMSGREQILYPLIEQSDAQTRQNVLVNPQHPQSFFQNIFKGFGHLEHLVNIWDLLTIYEQEECYRNREFVQHAILETQSYRDTKGVIWLEKAMPQVFQDIEMAQAWQEIFQHTPTLWTAPQLFAIFKNLSPSLIRNLGQDILTYALRHKIWHFPLLEDSPLTHYDTNARCFYFLLQAVKAPLTEPLPNHTLHMLTHWQYYTHEWIFLLHYSHQHQTPSLLLHNLIATAPLECILSWDIPQDALIPYLDRSIIQSFFTNSALFSTSTLIHGTLYHTLEENLNLCQNNPRRCAESLQKLSIIELMICAQKHPQKTLSLLQYFDVSQKKILLCSLNKKDLGQYFIQHTSVTPQLEADIWSIQDQEVIDILPSLFYQTLHHPLIDLTRFEKKIRSHSIATYPLFYHEFQQIPSPSPFLCQEMVNLIEKRCSHSQTHPFVILFLRDHQTFVSRYDRTKKIYMDLGYTL